MPYRLMSRSIVFLMVAALLLVPASFAAAAPTASDASPSSFWQQTWNLFGDLFADWFGEPAGNDRATAADKIGSLLDPDGFSDPNASNSAEECNPKKRDCGEIGSLLDPDG